MSIPLSLSSSSTSTPLEGSRSAPSVSRLMKPPPGLNIEPIYNAEHNLIGPLAIPSMRPPSPVSPVSASPVGPSPTPSLTTLFTIKSEGAMKPPTSSKLLRTSAGYVPVQTAQDFARVTVKADKGNEGEELITASKLLQEALALRHKYQSRSYSCPASNDKPLHSEEIAKDVVVKDGVYHLTDPNGTMLTSVPSIVEYLTDYQRMTEITDNGPVKSFTYYQLKKLDAKWKFHQLLSGKLELEATKLDPKDFSNVVKVDTHIHLAAGMTANQLLSFIKDKVRNYPDDVVSTGPSGTVTLKDVFNKMGINIDVFSVEMLDVHADNTFQRFDKFNTKYNPFGKSELRDIFLKTANYMRGKYFAELTKDLFKSLEDSKYIMAECRLSIYGRSRNEWSLLAKWANEFQVYSPHNQWMIQIPRLYSVFKLSKSVSSFQDMLDNIFAPMFMATIDPDYDPDLSIFLKAISGFDSVDDESRTDVKVTAKTVLHPTEWTSEENPPYSYYLYYMWANLATLNQLRTLKGLNTFDLRPHCGESGDVNHLASAFLVAKHINHGINLERSTSLQYLYYLAQIGLAVSPLSNDSLFLDLKRNPFPIFFRRGLNVSLSTDDPLQFHLTQTPLIEEYSVASQRWHMSAIDISEIARNSVLQSGYPVATKKRWLGPDFRSFGADGNDIRYTNVPDIRVIYRSETLNEQFKFIKRLEQKELATKSIYKPGSFAKIEIRYPSLSEPDFFTTDACDKILSALDLRKKYLFTSTKPKDGEYEFHMKNGIYQVFDQKEVLCSYDQEELGVVFCNECNAKYCEDCNRVLHKNPAKRNHHYTIVAEASPIVNIIAYNEFLNDYIDLIEITTSPAGAFCERRLGLLEASFDFHKLMNDRLEKKMAVLSNCDWEHTIKVDTHVHGSAAMRDVDLLEFIKEKIETDSNEVVMIKQGKTVTLKEIYDSLNIPLEHLTLDSLDMKAESSFKLYDNFKSKYTPFGHTDLRNIFLKHDNYIKGKYFAEVLKNTLQQHSKNPSLKFECRLSIYGRRYDEWDTLAAWVVNFDVRSDCNFWLIQIPRIYHLLKEASELSNFEQMIENIFRPLFEVTLNPDSHPQLHQFLNQVSGFDSVDDENISERKIEYANAAYPADWNSKENPPYAYYLYYMWANIYSLNYIRQRRGLNTFSFRPHCGQSGDVNHLISGFLFAKEINHGINLTKNPFLQYLYYLAQIGLSLSPLGENTMFTTYEHNPFLHFFKRGLNCSLSTDNPLMLHITSEPLIEEYTIAAKVWKLSIADLSEIARNSVLQCGFPASEKKKWIGENFEKPGEAGNDINKSNVPNIRIRFRHELLNNEMAYIYSQQSRKFSNLE